MSWLSQLKNFAFDRVLASAARSSTSVNPTAQSIGDAATKAVLPIVSTALKDVAAGIDAHKSPLGMANVVIGDAETGIKLAVDGLLDATLGQLPMVGGFLDDKAKAMANAFLDAQRDHFLTYLSAHFGHAAAAINAPAPTGARATSVSGGATVQEQCA